MALACCWLLPFQRTNTTTTQLWPLIGSLLPPDTALSSDWLWRHSVQLLSNKSPYLLDPTAAFRTEQKLQSDLWFSHSVKSLVLVMKWSAGVSRREIAPTQTRENSIKWQKLEIKFWLRRGLSQAGRTVTKTHRANRNDEFIFKFFHHFSPILTRLGYYYQVTIPGHDIRMHCQTPDRFKAF